MEIITDEFESDDEKRVFAKHIAVRFVKESGNKLLFIQNTMRHCSFDPKTERILVFVHRRSEAEESAEEFADKFSEELGTKADYYHAGRDNFDKEKVAERFISGDISILFATKAFGMGVDVKNIRYVFHATPPSSIEDYIQEIGRAGRDDIQSYAFLPYWDEDFNEIRSRQVKTQLRWDDVKVMHSLLMKYREDLVKTEQNSFVIPEDLIITDQRLNHDLYGKNAASVRQRMLLHCIEEAGRLEVSRFEPTHWPVQLGHKESDDTTIRKICHLAVSRGATDTKKTLIAERDLSLYLGLESDSDARDQLFYASKIGAIRIPFDVAIDWTKWAKDESNLASIDVVASSAERFLKKIRDSNADYIDVAHDEIHPSYLVDPNIRKKRRESNPTETRFDERKYYLIRFLRKVEGLRVTGSKSTASYRIYFLDAVSKYKNAKSWYDTLRQIPERARGILHYIHTNVGTNTIDEIYRAADIELSKMRLKDLELTLDYLCALGIINLSSELVPSAVRLEVKPAFTDPFDTTQDEKVRESLHERNQLRITRLDALQVTTRIEDAGEREKFVRSFFDAESAGDARRVVLDKALEVDKSLHQQLESMALEEYFSHLTLEQKDVVRASQTKNVIVQAGPGTGKTHTLINCVAQRLIASKKIGEINPGGPIPAQSILVLAYTRAVVEELRDRLRKLLTRLGRKEIPQIHTFHSYALMQLANNGRRDVKIKEAVRDFHTMFEKTDLPNPPLHIFVDEFQDIADERDDMLKTIMKRSPHALVTAIGDPDQSIYEYDRNKARFRSAEESFALFEKNFFATALSLSTNFRSDKEIISSAKSIFPRVLSPYQDADIGEVVHVKAYSTSLVEVTKKAIDMHRQVAVLFRTNAELYRDLPILKNAISGAELRVLGGNGKIVYSREVNEVLTELENSHSLEQCSVDLIEQVTKSIWKMYRTGSEAPHPWENRLVKHLRDGAILFTQDGRNQGVSDFIEWVRNDPSGHHLLYASELQRIDKGRELIISTMHRTKGLEFESVIITPSDMELKYSEIQEERRLRYVAVTRAKHRLVLINGGRENALEKGETWASEGSHVARKFDTIETDSDDKKKGAFSLFCFSEIQDYVLRNVREGDPLIIRDNALWHDTQFLCHISTGRPDLRGRHLEGIYVSEVIRLDGFGENDKYRHLYTREARERGWSYVVNAAGYLKEVTRQLPASGVEYDEWT